MGECRGVESNTPYTHIHTHTHTLTHAHIHTHTHIIYTYTHTPEGRFLVSCEVDLTVIFRRD